MAADHAAAALRADMMLIHAGAPLEPHDLASAWSLEPVVVVSLATAAGLYYRGTAIMLSKTTRNATALRKSRAAFSAGLLTIVVALVSPLHQLGGVLFSAHMGQHELLMTVAAPLFVLGQPAAAFMWGLPTRGKRWFASVAASGWGRGGWHSVSSPMAAWLLHGAAIWTWHAPRLYDASVRSEVVHSLQHYSFFVTALLFWWSIIRAGRSHRVGIAILSLFTTGLHTALLGALLSSIDAPLYLAYDATRAWGLSPVDDQQLGGIIMWVPGGVPYLVAALLLLARVLRQPHLPAAKGRSSLSPSVSVVRSLVVLLVMLGCGNAGDSVADLTGGYPERGRVAMRKYGCQSCHEIPGVTGAHAIVGPPLGGIAKRSFIGGVLVNSPDNMVAWLKDPPAHAPRTAMPKLGVTDKDARDMTAYLYSLQQP